jgi:predicted regulator of Ras-like GTPase activity (Roadblock/LC7/MglB family)
MQISKVNDPAKAENVFRSVLNAEGATITTGLPVSLVHTSTDGVKAVIANAAADYLGFTGVAVQDIANNDYGRIQISGFVNSVLLSNVGTSLTINANSEMVPSPAGFYAAAPTYLNSGFKFMFASNVPVAVSAAAYASGLIKTL